MLVLVDQYLQMKKRRYRKMSFFGLGKKEEEENVDVGDVEEKEKEGEQEEKAVYAINEDREYSEDEKIDLIKFVEKVKLLSDKFRPTTRPPSNSTPDHFATNPLDVRFQF